MRKVLVVLALFATGCGKETARVPFTSEGIQSTTANLSAGEVAFWTDIDLEHKGEAALTYDVELVQNGKTVATTTCDPLARPSVRTGWVETHLDDSHSRRGSGKMACEAKLPSGGPTKINVKLLFSRRPEEMTLRKADLVLKQ